MYEYTLQRAEPAWSEGLRSLQVEDEMTSFMINETDAVKPMGKIPRYAVPNIAASLPEYQNAEKEQINRAFHMSNYDQIRDLPEELKYSEISKTRREKLELAKQTLIQPNAEGKVPSQVKATTYTGTFEPFTYIISPYDLPRRLANEQAEESRKKIDTIGGGADFVPPGRPRHAKYEGTFGPHSGAFPYLGGAYAQADWDALRSSWLDQEMVKEGAFRPGGKDRTMATGQVPDYPAKSRAREIIGTLKGLLERDWEGIRLGIEYDSETEMIVVAAVNGSFESREGLVAYMNVLIRSNELLAPFFLARATSRWGSDEGDSFVFAIRPPWTPPELASAFYSLHPEHRTFTDLRQSGFFGAVPPPPPPPAPAAKRAPASLQLHPPSSAQGQASTPLGTQSMRPMGTPTSPGPLGNLRAAHTTNSRPPTGTTPLGNVPGSGSQIRR